MDQHRPTIGLERLPAPPDRTKTLAKPQTEAILRRFTESASRPTYTAMLEVGRAQKTIFVARYLRLCEL